MYHLPPISGCLRWMFSLGGGRGGSRKNLREEDFGMLKKRGDVGNPGHEGAQNQESAGLSSNSSSTASLL